jgi:hypothetical protein
MAIVAWNDRRASPRIFAAASLKSAMLSGSSGNLLSVLRDVLIVASLDRMKMALNIVLPRLFQQTEQTNFSLPSVHPPANAVSSLQKTALIVLIV